MVLYNKNLNLSFLDHQNFIANKLTPLSQLFIISGLQILVHTGNIFYLFLKQNNETALLSTQTHVLFVCFIALRPKSTAMVIAGRSVHLTTRFPGQA